MALDRSNRYPGRFENPTTAQPQGAFKNRTSPTAEDGSYFEADWANDMGGFFGAILSNAGVSPNGTVDTASSSQVYDALKALYTPTGVLNTPGHIKLPGGFTFMWTLGQTNSAGAADVLLPATFANTCLGALAIERNPYAWGQGIASTWAVQLNTLTTSTVQVLARQISGGTVSSVANIGCLVFAWGY